MGADGSNRRLVASLPDDQLYPSYSPSMDKILFASLHNADLLLARALLRRADRHAPFRDKDVLATEGHRTVRAFRVVASENYGNHYKSTT